MEKEQANILPAASDKENMPSFGKFQSAEELLKAYNSLESEFTKRSQKLREYETQAPTPKNDWETKVNNLFGKHPVADKYLEEIAKEIADNKDLINDENCLENALIKVLSNKIVSKQDMANDEEVIGMVLEKGENREKVIGQYLESIRINPLPKVLPKAGGAIPLTPNKPVTLSEAGKIAQKYLEEI